MFISDANVRNVMNFPEAIIAMEAAFRDFGSGNGAIQERVRIANQGKTFSMMGAIVPGAGLMGAKVYSTVQGKFDFTLLLFSNEDGRFLATMQGNALTEFRTAAVTVVAANHLAAKDARILTVFGTGVQAKAHLAAFLSARSFEEVRIVGRATAQDCATWVTECFGVKPNVLPAAEAVKDADIIVTATRAKDPLFAGHLPKAGAFIAAVGSSKPDSRELDDVILQRAADIVVEWLPQARREAGDLVLAETAVQWDKVKELGKIVADSQNHDRQPGDITVFKSIGIGLEDIALAEVVLRKLNHSIL